MPSRSSQRGEDSSALDLNDTPWSNTRARPPEETLGLPRHVVLAAIGIVAVALLGSLLSLLAFDGAEPVDAEPFITEPMAEAPATLPGGQPAELAPQAPAAEPQPAEVDAPEQEGEEAGEGADEEADVEGQEAAEPPRRATQGQTPAQRRARPRRGRGAPRRGTSDPFNIPPNRRRR